MNLEINIYIFTYLLIKSFFVFLGKCPKFFYEMSLSYGYEKSIIQKYFIRPVLCSEFVKRSRYFEHFMRPYSNFIRLKTRGMCQTQVIHILIRL